MVTPQPRVTVQQPVVTIPTSRVALPQLIEVVLQHPTHSMWTFQVTNPPNIPFQSIVGLVQPPLVDVNQPPIGG